MTGGDGHLVGRAAELATVADWVSDLVAGRGGTALVVGEPGIGKSALLAAAADAATAAGCPVHQGFGEELGQAFPLRPLLDAFDIRASSADPPRRAVLDALHGGQGGAPAAAAQALLDLVDRSCAASPAVLIVDDLHWADTTTVAVCHRLARTTAQRALLLIGAMRPLPRRDDLKALRAEVGRAGVLGLEPLPPAAVGAGGGWRAGRRPRPRPARPGPAPAGRQRGRQPALRHRVGRRPGPRRAPDHDRRHGRRRGRTGTGHADRGDQRPAAVPARAHPAGATGRRRARERFHRSRTRSDHLPAPGRAGAGARRSPRRRLVDSQTRLNFRHPLIRAALYDDLPSTVRAAWHRDAARALHQAGASPELVASQLLPTLADTDGWTRLDDWVIGWLLDAAAELAGVASEVAVRLLQAAVPQLPATDTRRHKLVSHLALALGYQADHAAVETLVGQTLPTVTDPDVLVALIDALGRARAATRERLPETLATIDQALTTVPGLTA